MSANYDNNTLHMSFGDDNQNDKKSKKGKNKVIIVILVILLIALVAVAVVFFVLPRLSGGDPLPVMGNNVSTNEVVTEEIKAQRFNSNLFYVYDSAYTPTNPADGYFLGNDYHDINEIIVPYININSNEATQVNEKIHSFYDQAVTKYNEYASSKNGYINVDYKYYMNKNVLSIIIEQIEGGNGIAQKQFYTCNYDLVKDKILTFDEVYKSIGFTDETIDLTVKYEIENSSFYKIYGSLFNEETIKTSIDATFEDYSTRKGANAVNYYIDSKGSMLIDMNYVIPNSGVLDRLLVINKANEQKPTPPEQPVQPTQPDPNSVQPINNVVENSVTENTVDPGEQPTGIVDRNGNLDLTNYEGFYACYFPRSTAVKTEIRFYKDQSDNKWYMAFANRNSYSNDATSKVVVIAPVELTYSNGVLQFNSNRITFSGTITFNEEDISLKVDQAALSTNITPTVFSYNVKENEASLLAENSN